MRKKRSCDLLCIPTLTESGENRRGSLHVFHPSRSASFLKTLQNTVYALLSPIVHVKQNVALCLNVPRQLHKHLIISTCPGLFPSRSHVTIYFGKKETSRRRQRKVLSVSLSFKKVPSSYLHNWSPPIRLYVQTIVKCPNRILKPVSVQTGYGAHTAFYRMGTGAVTPRVKRPGREADHSPSSSAEGKK